MNEPPESRCQGRSWLFESVERRDHEVARRDCLGLDENDRPDGRGRCPLFAACEALRDDFRQSQWQSGIHGTWAGQLFGKWGKPLISPMREHGTEKGYYQHKNRRETTCADCREALRVGTNARRATVRERAS